MKYFCILLAILILFGLLSRVFAISGNRIFFTVDEGRDAIYVRQILNYHQIFTKGPESSVRGIFTGPLWYYFISIGYLLMNGNPTGAVLVLILLNLGVTIVLVTILRREINEKLALTVGLGLMVSWPFFNTSLYGFNPFPLVALSIILILLLAKNKYGWALLPILLAFNTELAGAISFLIFYILVGLIFVLQRKINIKKYLLFSFLIPSIGLFKILFDYLGQPKNTTSSGLRVLAGTNFKQIFIEFIKMIGQVSIPQNVYLGFLVIIVITIFYIKLRKKNIFGKRIIYLALTLIFVSYLFFGSNHGWRAWHTVYIAPLVLISVLLMLYEFKKVGKILIVIILFLNIVSFKNNYIDYLKPSPNPSLLSNEEVVLDWIYTHNENNGFNLYTYTNSFYDYSYQYLISWYALPKYGFYPCEYSNFPLSIKALYIPGATNYVTPQLGCDKFRFLIIDSDTNGNQNKDWINDFRSQTILVDRTQIGNTTIEKRKIPDRIR